MRNKITLALVIILTSCQITYKKKTEGSGTVLDEELATKKTQQYVEGKDFWPETHYNATYTIVKNPQVKMKQQQLWEVCKGPVLSHLRMYQSWASGKVEYLKNPINFYTKSGYKKEAYVTKGMCQELALHSSHGKDTVKIDALRNLRFTLKQMTIQYVYTDKAYVSELVFDSKYSGVEYRVK